MRVGTALCAVWAVRGTRRSKAPRGNASVLSTGACPSPPTTPAAGRRSQHTRYDWRSPLLRFSVVIPFTPDPPRARGLLGSPMQSHWLQFGDALCRELAGCRALRGAELEPNERRTAMLRYPRAGKQLTGLDGCQRQQGQEKYQMHTTSTLRSDVAWRPFAVRYRKEGSYYFGAGGSVIVTTLASIHALPRRTTVFT